MKVIKKNVFYCDFCKKKSLSGGWMSVHEKKCTANPNRECGVCVVKRNIADVVNKFNVRFRLHPKQVDYIFSESHNESDYHEYQVEWLGEPVTLQEIRNAVGNCPNCILAVLRQVGFNKHYFQFEKFDYQKELKERMAEKNEEEYLKEVQSYNLL